MRRIGSCGEGSFVTRRGLHGVAEGGVSGDDVKLAACASSPPVGKG